MSRLLFALGIVLLALLPTGASAAKTERVSVDGARAQATGGSSTDPAISADGRFLAFHSGATNLVAGDSNGFADIFVHAD